MKKIVLLTLFTVFTVVNMSAQKNNFWTLVNDNVSAVAKTAQRESFPSNFSLYRLNMESFKSNLISAPDRFSTTAGVIITVPNAAGELERFEMFESSNFESELQAQFPEIRSYVGIGLDDPKAQLRISIDPKGVQAMVLRSGKKTEFMEPYAENGLIYAFYVSSRQKGKMPFTCTTVDHNVSNRLADELDNQEVLASNGVLKTFRLALSCTGEYGVYHGGTVAGALAAMNATMTRVNGVFEKDLAVRLNIIANNSLVVYTNAATDPYSPASGINNWNSQLQSTLTNVIGEANYDIGHLFGATGGGGNAGCIGCVCVNGQKGSGITSPADGVPAGDFFDIDYVAHELGHQLGANHTFSENIEGTGVNVEPGSGSTIMAYAGIMNNNVQSNSDDYFTYRSILQIQNNLVNKACAVNTTLNNPALTITSGGNWTIPNGTAFILTGTNPTNNPGATFTWEQNNNATAAVTGDNSICYPTKPAGPNFRSLPPSDTPVRYMPAFSSVLNNNLTTTWESVLTIGRSMTFTLTARDNVANGGQTSTASANITVSATVGPFEVTSQDVAGISWNQGTSETITWTVNNTTSLVGSSNVDILLSTDGGQTFSTVLAENVLNDGSETITVPNIAAPFCRIMIRPTGNIYYALNKQTFAIGYTITSTCNTYTYSTPFPIPDNGTTFTTATLNIPDDVTISDVNIGVNLNHTYLADLLIAVLGPGNNQVNLFERQCGSNDNLNVVFDDNGTLITCASPTAGTYQPAQPLSVFNGLQSAGNWVFGINDNFADDTGIVNSFFIEVCSQEVTLTSPDYGFDDFVIYPNPSKGNFTIQFYNSFDQVNVAIHDMRGRLVYDNQFNGGDSFNQNIQLNDAQTGVYLLSVTDGNRKEVKRIIIE